MKTFQDSLSAVAARVDKFLAADPYPETVRPAYLRDAVRYYPCLGGKRLRPALTLWCCELLGGDSAPALAPAAALEIWHNWTLVHDDIIDNDDFRRGHDATHRFAASRGGVNAAGGVAMALLAGDLQQGWAIDVLLRSKFSPELKLAMIGLLERRGNLELVSGEALDVDFSLRTPSVPAVEEIETMYRLKTGALLEVAAEFGAMCARGKYDAAAAELGKCFAGAGVAFQLKDDILGLFGNQAKFGKMIGSDLQESKPTVLFAESWRLASAAEREKLRSLCALPEYGEAELAAARAIVEECGALKKLEERAAELTERALEALRRFPENAARTTLEALVTYLACRDR